MIVRAIVCAFGGPTASASAGATAAAVAPCSSCSLPVHSLIPKKNNQSKRTYDCFSVRFVLKKSNSEAPTGGSAAATGGGQEGASGSSQEDNGNIIDLGYGFPIPQGDPH